MGMVDVYRQEKDRRRARLSDGLRKVVIPEHMHAGLYNYVVEGRPVGQFLMAVLRNDLSEACGRADPENVRALPAYVMLLTWYAPRECWGSAETVEGWLAAGEAVREDQRAVEALGKSGGETSA